jgi:hypothetical protein
MLPAFQARDRRMLRFDQWSATRQHGQQVLRLFIG